ncbi:alpha/beta hydrolase [Mucilaginibacter sp. PAMB04168]|uniref:alpha/beta fold hydrolase n=1 Tax=Mucilaginibacter sp. PAMB04168 TaxID=3138567 RepID=UPI0031F6CF79
MQERFDEVNGLRLHVLHEGEISAPIIIFLHGFPEFSFAWQKQVSFFAQHGFYALAPDQRGYNLSSKPKGVKAYVIDNLVADIAAWIKQLTPNKVILAAHDWGGGVAWALALKHPELLEKLVIMNMPHLAVMKKHLRTNPKQMLKSWYAAFFQLPVVPELVCRMWDYRFLVNAMMKSANPKTFTRLQMQQYKQAWSEPNALTSMLNWYRAFLYDILKKYPKVTVPTLIIWGKKDATLNAQMAHDSLAMCRQGKLVMLDNATHWLHHEMPDRVNQIILDFAKEELV